MPSIVLSAKVLKNLTCPAKGKTDYHDKGCKGLMLEVRHSGGRTWYLRYRDARGKQRQFRLADARDLSLEQARKRADELRGQIAMGADPTHQKAVLRAVPTFSEFIETQYLPHIKSYKRSWETDVSLLKNHLLPRFGKRHLDQISKQDIVMMHRGRLSEGAAPGSANRVLILMRYIFNLALKWEVAGLTKNPTAGVSTFEENNKLERYLTRQEVTRLYHVVLQSQNQMLSKIISMLILTGARKREVLDSRWGDFDLEKRSWRIPICKTGQARHVPLSDGALRVLELARHDLITAKLAITNQAWVFPNLRTGKPYVSFFTAWDTARKRAGLPAVRVHDLRHSFASFLINTGRSLYEVQKILGHTQVKTTQRYAHLTQETLIDAVNSAAHALDGVFSSSGCQPAVVELVAPPQLSAP